MRININGIGGNRRIYVFKDGAWNSKYQKSFENTYSKIELIEKLLKITLTSPSYGTTTTAKVLISSLEVGSRIFIKFNKPTGENAATLGIQSKINLKGLNCNVTPINTKMDEYLVVGCLVTESNMDIVVTFYSGATIFNISEIWLEKSGGGSIVPLLKNSLKRLKIGVVSLMRIKTNIFSSSKIFIYKNGIENSDFPILVTGKKQADQIILDNNGTYIKLQNVDFSKYKVYVKVILKYDSIRNNSRGLILDNKWNDGESFLMKIGPTKANVEEFQTVSYLNESLKEMYIRQINGYAKVKEIWLEKVGV